MFEALVLGKAHAGGRVVVVIGDGWKRQRTREDLSEIESVHWGWITFNEKHSRMYCDLKRVEFKKKCWSR